MTVTCLACDPPLEMVADMKESHRVYKAHWKSVHAPPSWYARLANRMADIGEAMLHPLDVWRRSRR